MGKKVLILGFIILLVIFFGAIDYLAKSNGLTTKETVTKEMDEEPIRIGLDIWPGWAPLYLAEEKGFFEKNGVNVEIIDVDYNTWSTALPLKLTDCEPLGFDTLQLNYNQGASLVVVMATDHCSGGDGILATKDITSLKDLKGREVAVSKGTLSYFFLLYLLERENMSSEDIIEVDIPAEDAGAAFASGKIDIAVTYDPWLSKSVKMRNDAHILVDTKTTPYLISSVLTCRKEVVEKRPEEIKGLMRAWFETLAYIEDNPNESNEIMAKHMKLSTEDFLEMKSNVKWLDYRENKEFFGSKNSPGKVFDLIDTAGRLWLEARFIKKPANASDLVDFSYLEDLYE